MQRLISPHGGELVNLFATPESVRDLQVASREWPSWDLTPRQLCDLELLVKHRVWVVDPLDGTREFVAGVPEWCVSVGLVENGKVDT